MSTAQIIASKDELIKQQTVQLKVQEQRIEKLQHQYQELLRALYGSKSERFVPTTTDEAQLHLFADQAAVEVQIEKEQISYERNRKNSNHPGRHKLPDHIPVIEQVIEPEENTEGLVKIGEEITESLDYTPASLIKLRIIRPKYVDKQADKVYIAAMPDRFMNKGIAEPGLLSHIVVNKYVDHLPLYRQAKQFDREFNWQVSASTLNNWMSYVCDRLEPIYMCMQRQILKSGYIQVDESPIKVLERKQGKQSKGKSPPDHKKKMIGYQWVYLSPQDKMVYFNYRQGRGVHGPKEILKDYQGYIQCDGYKVYDKIARKEAGIKLIRCLAHARRKFFEARDSDRVKSDYAMNIIKQIYELNRDYQSSDLQTNREELIKPKYDELLSWIKQECHEILPKSPIGKAMSYYQSQYQELVSCLNEDYLHLDNNWVENKIRPLALGRKNYLFAGSHRGARWMAMMYSFFGTCFMNDINPRLWLQETMESMTTDKIEDYSTLIPGYANT